MGRGRRPALPDEAAREILHLYRRRTPLVRIARQFDRDRHTIHRIIAGQSHRHVTAPGHLLEGPCDCVRCRYLHRQEANVDLAEAATFEFGCLLCDADVIERVLVVTREHGRVLCAKCEGRKAK